MIRYDPEAPLLSLHVPKTAGRSLGHLLSEWFPNGRLLTHYHDGSQLPIRHLLNGPVCVHGHFNASRGFGVDDYYPDIGQRITFLRDPFDRFVSGWFHMKRNADNAAFARILDKCPDFPDFINLRLALEAENKPSYSFLRNFFPGHSTVASFVKEINGRFVFIGITERYQDSINALAIALGKPKRPALHANASARDTDYRAWRPIYEKNFPDEFEAYQAALAFNDELLRCYRP